MSASSKGHWWVYIVQTISGKLYTGITTDVERRFDEHCGLVGRGRGAKFFRIDPARAVVYREACEDKSAACKREIQIKKMSRQQKYRLAGIA